ncbi:MAG TPA: periplasmic heavy metal sensor [Pseudomonadales bacterium]
MPSRKWLIALLVASLAVNLALGGFLVGQMTRPERPVMLDPSLSLFRVVRELPDARRDELRPTLRAHFRELRGDIRKLRAAQRGIETALTEEPFRPDALGAALTAFRSAMLDSQQRNHRLLVDVAGAMTADERALLVEEMKRPRLMHRRSRDHDVRRGPEREPPADEGAEAP